MKVSDFDFELPEERIAQHPVEPRDSARLLVHDVARDATRHLFVRDLVDVLAAEDLLVVNDTRVLPARLKGKRPSGGAVELLLLGPADVHGRWRAMVRPAKRLKVGELLELAGGAVEARACARELDASGRPGAAWTFEIRDASGTERTVEDCLERFGSMPLPPYIRRDTAADPRDDADRAWYQTVFAREPGAVAAPTAGLHFTRELLARLEARGVERTEVTLHVGAGTFKPVSAAIVEDHAMHAETYRVGDAAALAVERARARNGRVVAVGTTSARALESACDDAGRVRPGSRDTSLFITPGYEFRAVDALLTNFHLPRSTLLMLVSAFAGRERILRLYAEAIERGYRFYSYGDAMLLM
ncbi:MAG TPA: tRNA preQ1(34) S-adenosylmethionine ribosyltransferase-isomerase QueA [Planctomycetota bacterium]|nr:tRNA preQ1(34) S-adenosylmethionine ribosyltransferase-isomerase QueA [Planctomycetota bacterium]